MTGLFLIFSGLVLWGAGYFFQEGPPPSKRRTERPIRMYRPRWAKEADVLVSLPVEVHFYILGFGAFLGGLVLGFAELTTWLGLWS